MANTTFNGPVRSENGFEVITIDSTTGAVTTVVDFDSTGNAQINGSVDIDNDLTVDDQVHVKDGAWLEMQEVSGSVGPTDVIIGKNGSLSVIANPFTESASQLFPLGSTLIYGSKTFKYAFSGAAIAAGALIQNAAAVTTHRNLTPTAASAAATTVTVTLGGTNAATLNQYKNGYLHVNDVAGQRQLLKIASNPAANASASCVITLFDPVVTAITTSSKIDLIQNPYIDVVIAPTAETGSVVGVSPIAIADDRYFWAQTSGPASVITDGTIVLGHTVNRSDNLAGAVEAKADASLLQHVGSVMVVNGNTDNSVIMLNISSL